MTAATQVPPPNTLEIRIAISYNGAICEPNPGGVATIGWIAKRGDDEIHSHCAFACSGPDANSGMAEYRAVISALEWLLGSEYSDQIVVIRSDSQQIVYQIKRLARFLSTEWST
jgi:ribonuclease HI